MGCAATRPLVGVRPRCGAADHGASSAPVARSSRRPRAVRSHSCTPTQASSPSWSMVRARIIPPWLAPSSELACMLACGDARDRSAARAELRSDPSARGGAPRTAAPASVIPRSCRIWLSPLRAASSPPPSSSPKRGSAASAATSGSAPAAAAAVSAAVAATATAAVPPAALAGGGGAARSFGAPSLAPPLRDSASPG